MFKNKKIKINAVKKSNSPELRLKVQGTSMDINNIIFNIMLWYITEYIKPEAREKFLDVTKEKILEYFKNKDTGIKIGRDIQIILRQLQGEE